MTEPATPLTNQEAIAQLHRSMNFLIINLIQPSLRQAAANASDIAEINRAIAAEGEQVRRLRESVEILRESADDAATEAVELERDSKRQDASIAALREDALADRQVFREQAEADRAAFREALAADRQQWQVANTEAQRKADENRQSFKKELAVEREESARRFDAQMAEIRALGEQNRALLSALANINGRINNLERAS